jgi:hypothetical protein
LKNRLSWLRPATVLWASLLPDLPLFALTFWYFGNYEVGFGAQYDRFFYTEPLWVISHNLFHAPLIILVIGLVGWGLWYGLPGRTAERLTTDHPGDGGTGRSSAGAPRTAAPGEAPGGTRPATTAETPGGTRPATTAETPGGTRPAATAEASGGTRPAAHLLSFAFATGLHSFLDIFTHHDDGPLLLFPFDWSLRFTSPISYWDPEHYGNIFMPIDFGLTFLCAGFLIVVAVKRRRARARARG